MKKLFICSTPVQIIVALCIKRQLFNNNDENDLIITDTFSGYENIATRIKQLNIFNNVFVIRVLKNGRRINLTKYKYAFETNSFLKKEVGKKVETYDEMYFWNYDSFLVSLMSYFYKKNRNLKTFIFEEGYISYFPYYEVAKITPLIKIINWKGKLMNVSLTRENINCIFLFEPNLLLYKPNFKVIEIDRNILRLKDFKESIKYIFNVDNALKNYDKKYIILEEYHPEYNDEEVFNKIIDIVGKENVLIKLHPRSPEDRFYKNGIKTLGSDGIPWEALALLGDFSDKVIISIGSSSVTTQRILFGNEKMNAYLLFKCIGADLKQFDNKYSGFWDKLKSNNSQCGIHIPDTLDEFYAMLKKETEKDKK